MKVDPIQNLIPSELVTLARVVQFMLGALTQRVFTLIAMLLSAGGFAAVLLQPDWVRLAAACAFALLVFWPIQRAESIKAAPAVATGEPQ